MIPLCRGWFDDSDVPACDVFEAPPLVFPVTPQENKKDTEYDGDHSQWDVDPVH